MRIEKKSRSRSPQQRKKRASPAVSRRRRSSPLRRQRRRSLSPPRRYSRRGASRRSPPPQRRRRRSHSVSPKRRVPSPVEGLKRSVADSTISDDQLPQYNNISPVFDFNLTGGVSPKRVPLDIRINQVLGLEKDVQSIPTPPPPLPPPPPPPPSTNYYSYQQYKPPKVVQVGNMIQIVPTEECLTNSTPCTQQQILQVGNMLQIVPSETQPEMVKPPEPPTTIEDPVKQQKERKALEREKKRKEKERKRKEKEKRKQQKLKVRTERMIKRALLLEIEEEGGEEVENQENVSGPWPPPVPIVLNNVTLKPPGKGILLLRGLR